LRQEAIDENVRDPAVERKSRMIYRGIHPEEKTLMVEWQITIRKSGAFMRKSKVTSPLNSASQEAHAYIGGRIKTSGTTVHPS
jgi:hypothetical protein